MTKIFLLLFCSCATLCVQAQTVVYSIGANLNRFVLIGAEGSGMSNTVTTAWGSSLEINFQSVPYNEYKFGFALCMDRYGGSINAGWGGLGRSAILKLSTMKTVVGLALYPLDFQWGKHWHFQLGGVVSREVLNETTGFQSIRTGGIQLTNLSTKLADPSYKIGAITSIAYFWEFKKDWSLVPKYSFYGSFTNDIAGIEPNSQVIRHLFSIGISKRLTEVPYK